jgi:hypothetical protein
MPYIFANLPTTSIVDIIGGTSFTRPALQHWHSREKKICILPRGDAHLVDCRFFYWRIAMKITEAKFVVAIAFLMIALAGLCNNPASAQDPVTRRADRNLRQLDRQASRMANRADYYSQATWNQLNPWIDRYKLQPVRPLQQAANAADRAVDAGAAAVNRARFGFNDAGQSKSADVWFYDYYTYWPSYYYSSSETAKDYTRAARYFDYDNDGVYESYSNYRDSDKDGKYDEFDRYDFTTSDAEYDVNSSPNDAKRYTISGKIEAHKTARVNGVDFLIVKVSGDEENSVVVDLGPSDRWSEIKIQTNDSISATGPIENVGEKSVLMAEVATISKTQIRIDRPTPMFTGNIEDVTRVDVNGSEHVIVMLGTEKGNYMVDLGPFDSLKVKLEPKTKIVVHGVPVRMHDHQVVMAQTFVLDGKSHTITR